MTKDGFGPRLALVTLAAILVILVWRGLPLLEPALRGPADEPRTVAPRGDLAADEQTTIAIFENARDSVVSITTESRVVDFWTRNAYDVPRGSGSGFIWDAQGHVVTNNHVIEGATGALVRLADGRAYPARLVGTAPEHDLAVLRIDAGAEKALPLAVGVSETLRVGQSVFAIGNPFGLDWTLTTGIVSALDRELPGERGGAIRGLIQTDAAINPGNSGGPLLDSAGRLIGVNTAIYSPSGSSAGIGFAVPVDTVNRVVPQLIATGRYAPPTLGVVHDPRGDAMLARAAGLRPDEPEAPERVLVAVGTGRLLGSVMLRPFFVGGLLVLLGVPIFAGVADSAALGVVLPITVALAGQFYAIFVRQFGFTVAESWDERDQLVCMEARRSRCSVSSSPT